MFELVGDNLVWMLGDHGEECRVGSVGEGVAARFDDEPGIEVTVGDVAFDAVEVGEDEAQGLDGAVHALDVEIFGLRGWTLDREESEGANLGQDIEPAGIDMASDSRGFPIGFPVVVSGGLKEILAQVVQIGARNIGGKFLFVEDGFRPRDVGKEAMSGVTVDADGGLFGADDVGQVSKKALRRRSLGTSRPTYLT